MVKFCFKTTMKIFLKDLIFNLLKSISKYSRLRIK